MSDKEILLSKLLLEANQRILWLEMALRDLLLSADPLWQEKNLGHDWRQAVQSARLALQRKAALTLRRRQE